MLSAISGAPINETVGRDVNGDLDNTDRPIRGIDDATMPIRSDVDSQGRAVINGLDGPGSFLVDMSFRYRFRSRRGLESLDLFYDIFNCWIARITSRRRAIVVGDLHGADGGAVPTADAVRNQSSFLGSPRGPRRAMLTPAEPGLRNA